VSSYITLLVKMYLRWKGSTYSPGVPVYYLGTIKWTQYIAHLRLLFSGEFVARTITHFVTRVLDYGSIE